MLCRSIVPTLLLAGSIASNAQVPESVAKRATAVLMAKHGNAERERIARGVSQVRKLWSKQDGSPSEFSEFVINEFLPVGPKLDATFERLEFAFERMDGYATSTNRDLRRGLDLDSGPQLPIDERLAGLEATAHFSEDLFKSKVAFVVLLNFPLTTYRERLDKGKNWSRRQWAEARLAQRFSTRFTSPSSASLSQAIAGAESYISSYNIYANRLLTSDGQRLFPQERRLSTHWNLRDEIKACYGASDGLEKQRLLQSVMDAIVRQTIPAAVINSPTRDWSPGQKVEARESDARYKHWLNVFKAARHADGEDPDYPTYLDRRFERDGEMTESEVENLLVSVLSSPLAVPVGKLLEGRLGRKLEPFDIYYTGFNESTDVAEADLDQMTRKRYPTADAFAADIPRLLTEIGFAKDKASFLGERIVVEPARGTGHASGPARRDDKAHLRTRIEAGGMDYKSFNIAVHELGHNVEQVFSVAQIDHTLLYGVPSSAITEALAFVFQARDLQLLGASKASETDIKAVGEFWAVREVAGAGLVDLKAWRWLYDHPKATPAQFRTAVVQIAQDVWNQYFAQVFGARDVTILGIYSHMIQSALYLPDYTIARVFAFQIEEHFATLGSPMGPEFERMARIGYLTPDAWMREAVGSPLTPQPLFDAVDKVLKSKYRS